MMHKKLVFVYVLCLITTSYITCSEQLYPKSSIVVELPPKKIIEKNLKKLGYQKLIENSDLIEKMYEKTLSPLQFATVVRQAYFQHDERLNITLDTIEEQRQRHNQRNYLFHVMLCPSDALGELYSLGLYKLISIKHHR